MVVAEGDVRAQAPSTVSSPAGAVVSGASVEEVAAATVVVVASVVLSSLPHAPSRRLAPKRTAADPVVMRDLVVIGLSPWMMLGYGRFG